MRSNNSKHLVVKRAEINKQREELTKLENCFKEINSKLHDKYLSNKSPAYIMETSLSIEDVINFLRNNKN